MDLKYGFAPPSLLAFIERIKGTSLNCIYINTRIYFILKYKNETLRIQYYGTIKKIIIAIPVTLIASTYCWHTNDT